MHISTPLRERPSSPPSAASASTLSEDLTHRLHAVIESATDLSSWSDQLAAQSTTWPLKYFFSPARANVLRGLSLPMDGVVLEIGARAGAVTQVPGDGAVTRYLGEESVLVDALEPDGALAAVAAARCADLPGVVVHPAWLDAVPAEPTYDLVVAVDVLGELEHRDISLEQLLRECRSRLRPGGLVVLCADNVDGVRHRTGGLPPGSGITSPRRPPWLLLDDLHAAVASVGLTSTIASALPDHRFTKVLFDHAALTSIDPRLVETLPAFPSDSYGAPVVAPDRERSLWSSLVASGEAGRCANSIVAVIGDTQPAPIEAATYWSLGRAAALSARNRVQVADGVPVVDRGPAFPRAPGPDGPLGLRPHVEVYRRGRSVVDLLLSATQSAEARELLRRWVSFVGDSAVDGHASWDLIPRNVIIDPDDVLHAIDQEWELPSATVDSVLRRGFFWLANDLMAATARPPWLRGRTHGEAADFLVRLAGHPAPHDWLTIFVQEEAAATSFVGPLNPPRSRSHVERQNGHILSAISQTSPQPDPASDGQAPGADEASLQEVVDSLLATNEELRREIENLQRQRRHDALTQRDHAIGITAELEIMRDRVGRAQAAQKLAMTKVRRLRKQVASMQESTSWRVGRAIVKPVARLKGRR